MIPSALLLLLLDTAGLARVFLGESLRWMEPAGGLVLLAGVLVIIQSQKETGE